MTPMDSLGPKIGR